MADGTTPRQTHMSILKRNDDQRLVFGWLYVSKTGDQSIGDIPANTLVVDHSGETVPVAELEKASYGFALKHRAATEMHKRTCPSCGAVNEIASVRKGACLSCKGSLKNAAPTVVGQLVEIVVFTAEKRKAMGLPEGSTPDAIWCGFHIDDDDAWEGVKSGKYKMLSFGSRAIRSEIGAS